MSIRRVNPAEALDLTGEGWTLVDVRSIPEFEDGHPAGAYNVPFLHKIDGQMRPNEDFLAVMEKAFPKDTRLLLSCRSGGRSLKAAELLSQRGYSLLIDVRGGYLGEVDASGVVHCEGWVARALPTSSTAETGRSYNELK